MLMTSENNDDAKNTGQTAAQIEANKKKLEQDRRNLDEHINKQQHNFQVPQEDQNNTDHSTLNQPVKKNSEKKKSAPTDEAKAQNTSTEADTNSSSSKT